MALDFLIVRMIVPVKPMEDLILGFGRDASSGVADAEDGIRSVGKSGQNHTSAGDVILNRIVDQVHHGPPEEPKIAGHNKLRRHLEFEAESRLRG